MPEVDYVGDEEEGVAVVSGEGEDGAGLRAGGGVGRGCLVGYGCGEGGFEDW